MPQSNRQGSGDEKKATTSLVLLAGTCVRFAGSAPERKHIQSLAFAIESSVGVFVMIGETETTKKMPDGEEKQGRRAQS